MPAQKREDNTLLKYEKLKNHIESSISFEDRTIYITGDIGDDADFEFFNAAMCALERDSRRAITIQINSRGGDVYEALAIVGRMSESPCKINTKAYGHVMSAATLILASGDSRKMSQYATFMHHCSSYGISGDHDNIMNEVKYLEQCEQQWAAWMANLSLLSAEEWRERSHGKNYYLDAHSCMELGIVDDIF